MIYSKFCGEYTELSVQFFYVNTNLGYLLTPIKTGTFSLDG